MGGLPTECPPPPAGAAGVLCPLGVSEPLLGDLGSRGNRYRSQDTLNDMEKTPVQPRGMEPKRVHRDGWRCSVRMLETKLTGKSPQEAGKGAGKQAQRERGWAAAQARAELTQQKTSKLAKEDVERGCFRLVLRGARAWQRRRQGSSQVSAGQRALGVARRKPSRS